MNPIEQLIQRAQTVRNEKNRYSNTAERVGSLIEDFLSLSQSFVKNQFVMTGKKTITNTTDEQSLVNSGVGSLIIPSHYLTPGKHIQLKSKGYISTSSNVSATLKIKLGGVDLISSTAALPSSLVQRAIAMDASIRINDDSTVTLSGYTLIQADHGVSSAFMRSLVIVDEDINVDLTEDQLLEHTYQWSVASEDNNITITNFEVIIK